MDTARALETARLGDRKRRDHGLVGSTETRIEDD
jgi:hypothetical protein